MYRSLQGTRAVAAMLVVLFHLGSTLALSKYFGIDALAVPFKFGSAGVEFFFVLSGFIILSVHAKDIDRPDRLAAYIRKRISRIFPIYWIIFLSIFVVAMLLSGFRDNVPKDVSHVLASLLLIPQEAGAPVVSVAWTLQYEMCFYLFFAVLIASRWVALALGCFYLYLYSTYSGSPSVGFPLSFIFRDYVFLFMMGALVSFVNSKNKSLLRAPVAVAGFGVALFALVAIDVVAGANLLNAWRTILYGIASAVIILGLVQAENRGKVLLDQNWLQLMGQSSYSLYLIHFTVIGVFSRLAMSIGLNGFGWFGAMATYGAILCACIAISLAFHIWVEKPIAGYLGKKRGQPSLLTS